VDDPYLEETFARIHGVLREQVRQLQAGEDAHPVVFYTTAKDEQGRRLLAQLGFTDLAPDQATPLQFLTRVRVRTLLNKQVSPGLGAKLMDMPLAPPHAFLFLGVLPDRIDGRVCVIEDERIYSVAAYSLDVATRMLRFQDEDGNWNTARTDW
jgi:hypothetical protein